VTKTLLRALEGTLSRLSRLQSLAPTNQHWARVVGYGPFSSCIIHKEGLCPSSGDINRLMMMMTMMMVMMMMMMMVVVVVVVVMMMMMKTMMMLHRPI
jgi:hypothetical protein